MITNNDDSEKLVKGIEVQGTITPDTKPNESAKPIYQRKKYEMCKNFREKGNCKYGDKCLFAHGDHEISRREPTIVVNIATLP